MTAHLVVDPYNDFISEDVWKTTVRYAFELGYEVTKVRDATADYSDGPCTKVSTITR